MHVLLFMLCIRNIRLKLKIQNYNEDYITQYPHYLRMLIGLLLIISYILNLYYLLNLILIVIRHVYHNNNNKSLKEESYLVAVVVNNIDIFLFIVLNLLFIISFFLLLIFFTYHKNSMEEKKVNLGDSFIKQVEKEINYSKQISGIINPDPNLIKANTMFNRQDLFIFNDTNSEDSQYNIGSNAEKNNKFEKGKTFNNYMADFEESKQNILDLMGKKQSSSYLDDVKKHLVKISSNTVALNKSDTIQNLESKFKTKNNKNNEENIVI